MKKVEKSVIFEDKESLEKSRALTLQAVDLINQAQQVYLKWGLASLTIDQYVDISMELANFDDIAMTIKEKVAKNATELKKLNISHSAIMNMVKLPDTYEEFETKLKKLVALTKEIPKYGVNYAPVFPAIVFQSGVASINQELFDEHTDYLRIYATNETQQELVKAGELAAKSLNKLCKILTDVNEINPTEMMRGFVFHEYFSQVEGVIKLRYGRISNIQNN